MTAFPAPSTTLRTGYAYVRQPAHRQGGDVALRWLFPGVTDNAQARECARTIAGWKPLPLRTVKRAPKMPRAEHRG